MDNNDLLRRLRYALRSDDAATVRLIKLGGGNASLKNVESWRLKHDQAGFQACNVAAIEQYLNGLIIERRGPHPQHGKPKQKGASVWPDKEAKKWKDDEGRREQDAPSLSVAKANSGEQKKPTISASGIPISYKETSTKTLPDMDNNVVLKQLRIALALRSDDIHRVLKAGGSALSETEASALFRNPAARNYRRCGDQVLKQFIKGLAGARTEG